MSAGNEQPQYGNWASAGIKNLLLFACVLGTLVTVLSFLLVPDKWVACIILALITAVEWGFFVFVIVIRHAFSQTGGGVQNKLLNLLLDQINWDGQGEALDIGCGSGALSIKLAKRYPNAKITGIDYWNGMWGYSKSQCEENARIEGVEVVFRPASAMHLPFESETFDLVVSNLVFHEVRECKNKLDVVYEALRVVKKGGAFVFQDLFLFKPFYGTVEELIAAVKSTGVDQVRFIDTSKSAFISRPLRFPLIVGTIGILKGIK